MDAQMLKENWKSLRDAVRVRWPLLTDDDLLLIDGDAGYLAATLATRYAWSGERATREVRGLDVDGHAYDAEAAPGFADAARASLGPGAQKIREGLDELGAGFRDLAREQVGRVRDAAASGADRAADSAHHAADAARERAGAATERLSDALERVEQFVRERPYTSIGIAFVAGYLLFGRRS